jgi:hypothetical protein
VRITPEDASNAVTVAVQSGESLDGTTDGTDSVDSLGIYEYVDAGTGTWISTANDFYSRDGSLSGDRTVTVGPHTLNFLGGSVFSSQYLANAALQLNDTTINLDYGTSTQFQGVTITDGVAGDTTINITGDITNPEINSVGFWVENADAITRNVVFNSAIKDTDGSTNLGTVALAAGAEILFAWVKNGTTYTTIYRSDGLDFLPLSGGTMTGNLLMGTNILSLGDSSLVDDGDLEIEANGNTVFTMTDALVTSEVDLAVSGDVDINGGYLEMTEMVAPADPAANTGRLYVADDASTTKLYFRDSIGTVTDLLAGGGGLTNWSESGNDLIPNVAGYSLGNATNEIGDLYLDDGARVMFGIAQDVVLQRSAADVLSLARSGNAQSFRLYNDATGGVEEWLELDWQTTPDVCRIATATSGGAVQELVIGNAGGSATRFDGGAYFHEGGDLVDDYVRIWATNSNSIITFSQGALVQGPAKQTYQLTAPLSDGDTFSFETKAGDYLNDTDGRQAFIKVSPLINQSGTAAYDGIYVNVDEATHASQGNGSTGDGNNLLNLAVDGTSLFRVNNAGAMYAAELSADPTAPAEGEHVIWQSDGTGSGDDGDIMLEVQAGATTNTVTLYDHSAATIGKRSYAEYYISTPAASAAITAGTPIEIGGTATAGDSSSDFTIATATGGRATYTGTLTKRFRVTARVSATSTKGNEVMSIFIAEGGAALAKSETERKIGTGSDVGSVSTSAIVELATNEFVEVFVDLNASTSDTITAEKCVLVITEL